MDDAQLIQMIRQGGIPRERANRRLQDKFFYLIRQIGVRQQRLSYEDALSAFCDALTELDIKIRQGEAVEDLGKMLYTLTHRRGVDIIRKRTTKSGTDPLNHPTAQAELAEWFLDIVQHTDTDHVFTRLINTHEKDENTDRLKRISACVQQALEQLPRKRRALLANKLDGFDYEELKQIHGFKTERVAHEMVSRGMNSLRETLKTLCQQEEPVCRDLCTWLNRKNQL